MAEARGRRRGVAEARAEADRIGYPILVKASAGGGGKGMRIVQSAADLVDAIAGAKRESQAAFGDDTLLLERYLTAALRIALSSAACSSRPAAPQMPATAAAQATRSLKGGKSIFVTAWAQGV